MSDVFKVKPKARLHVGAALNQVKLATTATTHDEFRSYIASANESLSKAMEAMRPNDLLVSSASSTGLTKSPVATLKSDAKT